MDRIASEVEGVVRGGPTAAALARCAQEAIRAGIVNGGDIAAAVELADGDRAAGVEVAVL